MHFTDFYKDASNVIIVLSKDREISYYVHGPWDHESNHYFLMKVALFFNLDSWRCDSLTEKNHNLPLTSAFFSCQLHLISPSSLLDSSNFVPGPWTKLCLLLLFPLPCLQTPVLRKPLLFHPGLLTASSPFPRPDCTVQLRLLYLGLTLLQSNEL